MRKTSEYISRLRSGGIEVSNRRYEKLAQKILASSDEYDSLADHQLRTRAFELVHAIRQQGPDANTVNFFALVREVANRTVGMKPYNVQLIAALALNDGKVVEMQTGEGKTLAAVLPVCLQAIAGRGAHVLTFNDYLAVRDAKWMGPIYDFLGLNVGHIRQDSTSDERRAAYACDVTYVTAREVGFDYLRDQLCLDARDQCQRGFHFAIVDEADSTLVDEARVPLVIAGEDNDEAKDLSQYAGLIRQMKPGIEFTVQQGRRNASFSAAGLDWLQNQLGRGDLFAESNIDILTRMNLALHAETLLERDVDYIVRDGEIELIDEFTGRVAENRRWPYGLQAAIEAKENLVVQPQGRILKSITLQHFLENYDRLSGMTGTAQASATEVHEFYLLRTVVIPPNRPCIRIDHDDVVFASKRDKHLKLIEEICTTHKSGRPVLVGTSSIEESETLAGLLAKAEVKFNVLNARNDFAEAEIIAEAGDLNAITISTNMAGRGTDIKLGGREGKNRQQVVDLGGLYVIGTNRHESRRIDDQLRGRAGRQGDPGESRFFVSGEDDLLSRCGIGQLDVDLSRFEAGIPVTDPRLGNRIARIQKFIEAESLEIRRTLRMYTTCLEQHRHLMQVQRQSLLENSGQDSVLKETDEDLWQSLVARFGETMVREAERSVAIFHIDDCWADHLQMCSEVRNSIYLASIGGFNAVDEFNRRVNASFRGFNQRVSTRVVDSFRQATLSGSNINLDDAGIGRPSSTWTYMINDNPTGEVIDRLSRGLVRLVRKLG